MPDQVKKENEDRTLRGYKLSVSFVLDSSLLILISGNSEENVRRYAYRDQDRKIEQLESLFKGAGLDIKNLDVTIEFVP